MDFLFHENCIVLAKIDFLHKMPKLYADDFYIKKFLFYPHTLLSSMTYYMHLILYDFTVALFNLYVLQDPSILKSKFLI